jgi:hypothetical protein
MQRGSGVCLYFRLANDTHDTKALSKNIFSSHLFQCIDQIGTLSTRIGSSFVYKKSEYNSRSSRNFLTDAVRYGAKSDRLIELYDLFYCVVS